MTTAPHAAHPAAPPQQGQSFNLNQGGGSKSFSFGPQGSQPGAYVSGVVVDVREVQETNYDTKKPEFWEDGSPKMQIRVTLQTELHLQSGEQGDDGKRDIYLNGYKKPHPNTGTHGTLFAVMEAVRAVTGGTEMAFGSKLTLQWVSGMGFTGDPRHYQAWYELPQVNLNPAGPPPGAQAPVQQPTAQQAPPQQFQQPVQQQVPAQPAAAPAGPPPEGSTGFVPPNQGPAPEWAAPAQQAAPPQQFQQPQAAYAGQGAMPVAGQAGAPLTAEQIQAVRNMNVDPALAFGPDWESRVVG